MAAIAERIGFVSASLGRGLSLGARRCCLAGSSGSFDSLAVAQRFNCLFFFCRIRAISIETRCCCFSCPAGLLECVDLAGAVLTKCQDTMAVCLLFCESLKGASAC
jgi:hypothetical protein